jgi:C-terminal processing protease CtpA/Prc
MTTARRLMAGVFAVALMAGQAGQVRAENKMGYLLLTQEEARTLPHNGGALGLDVERGQEIRDQGLDFELIRVKSVRDRAPGAAAGLRRGDEIIAVDGRVFPSLATFAAYIGAAGPGSRLVIDYIPNGGGPAQAQRVTAQIGSSAQRKQADQGMSTGTKLAIGAGAAALFGCYELGCFKRSAPPQQQGVPGR